MAPSFDDIVGDLTDMLAGRAERERFGST